MICRNVSEDRMYREKATNLSKLIKSVDKSLISINNVFLTIIWKAKSILFKVDSNCIFSILRKIILN